MTTAPVRVDAALEALDDAVLFDVVREAGNRLLGRLLRMQAVARAAGRHDQAVVLEREELAVADEMASVWGRNDLIGCFRSWNARFAELSEQ